MFKTIPFILLSALLAIIALESMISIYLKSFFYTLSLTTKAIIVFLLPILVFMLLFKTISQLGTKSTKWLAFLFCGVVISNFLSTMISYCFGSGVYQLNMQLVLPPMKEGLLPLWTLTIPQWITNSQALISGVIFGIIFAVLKPSCTAVVSIYLNRAIQLLLKIFTMLIPFFLFGFLIKLAHDGVMGIIIKDYGPIFCIVALIQLSYIALLYLIVSRFDRSRFFSSLKNMAPPLITGFSSMSSAAAMPLTLTASGKNVQDPAVARLCIPTTVNIHLIGDCLAIPIFAFAVMKQFGVVEPSFLTYATFAGYFVLAKFSVAAIPGGGIIVMLPFLESCFGFHPEMAALITALYVLFDPVITSANILGNGAFAMIMDAIFSRKTQNHSA